MNIPSRFRRMGYVNRGPAPSILRCLGMLPLALACKLRGWKRDSYGRLYRRVRPEDAPSAMFARNYTLWFDPRYAGGERVICWSYWSAWLFDLGAWHLLLLDDEA